MTKFFSNNIKFLNLYKHPSNKSEVVTQMIYGDTFSISKKLEGGLKLKLKMTATKVTYKTRNMLLILNPVIKSMF